LSFCHPELGPKPYRIGEIDKLKVKVDEFVKTQKPEKMSC
jgi:hypothetical protein